MILIADSGSTKTDWAFVENGEIKERIETPGINPVHMSESQINEIIDALDSSFSANQSSVYFYGAGCIPPYINKVEKALASQFPDAEIHVESDMLGAARAAASAMKQASPASSEPAATHVFTTVRRLPTIYLRWDISSAMRVAGPILAAFSYSTFLSANSPTSFARNFFRSLISPTLMLSTKFIVSLEPTAFWHPFVLSFVNIWTTLPKWELMGAPLVSSFNVPSKISSISTSIPMTARISCWFHR